MTPRVRIACRLAAAALCMSSVPPAAAAEVRLAVVPHKSTVGPRADFNGDGYGDLAVGVPGEAIGNTPDAGAVNALYGSASGLSSTGNQYWNQNSGGVLGTAQGAARFGAAVAVGDFNDD